MSEIEECELFELSPIKTISIEAKNRVMLCTPRAVLEISERLEHEARQTALKCIELIEGYPTTVSVHATAHDAEIATNAKENFIRVIKRHFKIEYKDNE